MKTAIVSTKLKQAQEAYEAGDFAIAHALFLQAAKQKSTIAQFCLGNMYAKGEGVAENPIQAADWYRQAAERGYPLAQAKLAELYANGCGVPLDYRQAAQWFKLAAEQKDKTPEHRLTEANEAYTTKNYDLALALFQELAQTNEENAQFHLGEMYAEGLGIDRDLEQAAQWYRLAAEQGCLAAQVRLGKMYANGLGVKQDYREAAMWLDKAAAQAESNNEHLFEKAQTAYQQNDYKHALTFFRTLAERECDAAQYYLGSMYTHGYGVEKDDNCAAQWYFQAAQQGYASALTMLREQAKEGLAAAQFYMGELYSRALGVMQDNVLAADSYLHAAQQGHIKAQAKMGELYAKGQGVPQDYQQASLWYGKAAQQHDELLIPATVETIVPIVNPVQPVVVQIPTIEKIEVKKEEKPLEDELVVATTELSSLFEDIAEPSQLTMHQDKIDVVSVSQSSPIKIDIDNVVSETDVNTENLTAMQLDINKSVIKQQDELNRAQQIAQAQAQIQPFGAIGERRVQPLTVRQIIEAEQKKLAQQQATQLPIQEENKVAPRLLSDELMMRAQAVSQPIDSEVSLQAVENILPRQPVVDHNNINQGTLSTDRVFVEQKAVNVFQPEAKEISNENVVAEDASVVDNNIVDTEHQLIEKAEHSQSEQHADQIVDNIHHKPTSSINANEESTLIPAQRSGGNRVAHDVQSEALFRQAVVDYEHGNYSAALPAFQQLALKGNADAQYYLGTLFDNGLAVNKDERQAAEWYLKAADQNHVVAQYNLGVSYARGQGILQNYQEAVHWYLQAAQQGYTAAQNNLGELYASGLGVEQDFVTSAQWFMKAAEQGDAVAQYNLGVAFANGRGVEQSDARALEYFKLSAKQGNAAAQYNLGVRYESGHGVPQDYRQAAEWYLKSAEQGYASAQNNLGLLYADGNGVPQDSDKAADWCERAADQGHADAQFNLGLLYAQSLDSVEGQRQAAAWYLKAAEQGHAAAQTNLAVAYFNGWGVEQDREQAVTWYRAAAEQGVVAAQYGLGWLYFHNTPPNYEAAEQWWREAAKQGDKNAQQGLEELARQQHKS